MYNTVKIDVIHRYTILVDFDHIGAWLKNRLGQTMTFLHVPGIVKEALPSVITPRNIMAGFEKADVTPYNRNIFTEEDLAPSMVTDRPSQHQTNEIEPVPLPPTTLKEIDVAPIEEIPVGLGDLINAVLG